MLSGNQFSCLEQFINQAHCGIAVSHTQISKESISNKSIIVFLIQNHKERINIWLQNYQRTSILGCLAIDF